MRPGWYRMPDGRAQWWDGRSWSEPPPQPQAMPPAPSPGGALALPPTHGARPTVVHDVHVPQKDVGIAYLFALLLGSLGGHRFYLGRTGSAVAMLLLWFFGALGSAFLIGLPLLFGVFIWWIVDLCTLPGMVREANARGMAAMGLPPQPTW